MRLVAATVALFVLAVPGMAGVAAWSACAAPPQPRCCCPGDGDGCGCGCGAGQTPARAPEPVAPLPLAPEHGLTALPTSNDASTSGELGSAVTGLHDRSLPTAADLFITICTFRC